MQHLDQINAMADQQVAKSTGRFYTPPSVGRRLAALVGERVDVRASHLRIVDPFCGDGRLVRWLLEVLAARRFAGTVEVGLWDLQEDVVRDARDRTRRMAEDLGLGVEVQARAGDSFSVADTDGEVADVVITNPPWERLKPDRRDTAHLIGPAEAWSSGIRAYSQSLATKFPLSRPGTNFSGVGTNLSRVGTELSLKLTAPMGHFAIVTPPSLFADQDSAALRAFIVQEFSVHQLDFYPAEARLFAGVDQPVALLVGSRNRDLNQPQRAVATVHDEQGLVSRQTTIDLAADRASLGDAFPNAYGIEILHLLPKLRRHPRLADLEGAEQGQIWAGREIDETRVDDALVPEGRHPFVRGRMIRRFGMVEQPTQFVAPDRRRIPKSTSHPRIVWRDVSRPNQKRRVQATLIPPGWVAGNSLGVMLIRGNDLVHLASLLAVVNSLAFEAQVRASLSTGHVSLGAIRQATVPAMSVDLQSKLAELTNLTMNGDASAEAEIEATVAMAYGLNVPDVTSLVASFPKLSKDEGGAIIERLASRTRPSRMSA